MNKLCVIVRLGTDKQNRNYMMRMGTRDPPYVGSVPTWTRLSVRTPSCTCDLALTVSPGLIFASLPSQILGVWLAVRYRNQKDPRANPSAFL